MSLWKPEKVEEYGELAKWLTSVKERSMSEWAEAMRWYCRNDLFFLLTRVMTDGQIIHSQLGIPFYNHQHYLDACRQYEWQLENGGGADVSGRGSGKSTIRTKASSIMVALRNPDASIVIFSARKLLGRKHLRVIKDELEVNSLLKLLFDDVLYEDPVAAAKDGATVWSLEDGLRVKRSMIRSTQTIEVHSAFDGGPVGTRFDMLHVDDLETQQIVGNPDMQAKLEEAYSSTISLLTPVALEKAILFITNTRFSEAGLVQKMFDKYASGDKMKVRAVPGELLEDVEVYGSCYEMSGTGPLGGVPLYPLTQDILFQRYEETAVKSDYGLQMCLSYTAAEDYQLHIGNIQYYEEEPSAIGRDKNIYVCIDASKGVVDPTAVFVWGLGKDRKYYWLDGIVRKMDPSKPEYHDAIFGMVEKWGNLGNRVVEVRVEQYGGSIWADIIRKELGVRGCYVPVRPCTSVAVKTGKFATGKLERIFQRWSPMLNSGLVLFPKSRVGGGNGIMCTDDVGARIDLVTYFLENELRSFPRCKHDDLLDAGALVQDPKVNEEYPLQFPADIKNRDRMRRKWYFGGRRVSWMSAS